MIDIKCYYLNKKDGWVLFAVDHEGNQLWDAEFYPNRKILQKCWAFDSEYIQSKWSK